jgi:predicted metal-binding transcription factor (methanogenesis marker protein 9)
VYTLYYFRNNKNIKEEDYMKKKNEIISNLINQSNPKRNILKNRVKTEDGHLFPRLSKKCVSTFATKILQ